ncbi:hypothetical protein D7V91_06735 [bacterium 1xD42-67]|nr:hypothetical protein D7V91_06735 [bacterium 1xD42-67]
MASINGVSSSNGLSSLMNSANMISGLASGLDTESMIEGLVKSYQTKINTLNQKVTKTEWKQDAYRSIISKMVGFSSKYTSYTSSTNLMSAGFFSSAAKVTTQGLYKDLVAASGKSSSDISLDAVRQLATSAQYRTDSNLKAGDGSSIEAASGIDLDGKTTLASLGGSLSLTYGSKTVNIQFDQVADVEAMKSIEEKMVAEGKTVTTEGVLAELINQKLSDEQITLSSGAVKASDRIEVTAENGTISFKDKANAGNSVYISSAGDTVKSALGLNLDNASEDRPSSITISSSFKKTVDVDNAAYLSGRSMNLSLDGTTKTIKLPEIVKGSDGKYRIKDAKTNMLTDYNADNYAKAVNNAVKDAFKGKVEVSNAADDGSLKLRFEVQEGSDLVVNTDVGDTLGLGRTASTYLNTSKTLGDLLGEDKLAGLEQATKTNKDGTVEKLTDSKGDPLYAFKINGTTVGNFSKNSTLAEVMSAINGNKEASVQVSYSQTTKNFLFTSKETGVDSEIDMGEGLAQAMFGSTEIPDNSGVSFAKAYGISSLEEGGSEKVTFRFDDFDLTINVSSDDTIEDVAAELNKSIQNDGYTASYNKYTGQLEIADKDGAAVEYSPFIPADPAFPMFGDTQLEFDKTYAPAVDYTPGQDAKFTVTVNGETKEMTRSSNSVNIDGLTITMKDVFDGAKDADGNAAVDSTGKPKNSVTFKSTTDSDKIVDAVKSMIEDYNAMMSEIKSAYATMPYRKSNGTFADYEPLTDEERQGMSESAIERYEEKAKQGILFGDRNLSNLYDKMRNIFNLSGEDGATLRAMGISTSYSISDGTQTITLDEGKLRDMLDSDPERVTELFTKTDGTGGIMQNMKTQLDNYAKTTGEPKGILVQQAGSPLSSLSLLNNSWQKEIDSLNTQVERWQDKLSDQVDRYTQQFTRLEMLINQMNSQSSTLAGLMGG